MPTSPLLIDGWSRNKHLLKPMWYAPWLIKTEQQLAPYTPIPTLCILIWKTNTVSLLFPLLRTLRTSFAIALEFMEGLQRNFSQRGRSWERPALFQFFEQGASGCEIQQNIGIRTYGNKGWVMARKSLLLYARNEYGKKRFKHSFFKDKESDSFKDYSPIGQ